MQLSISEEHLRRIYESYMLNNTSRKELCKIYKLPEPIISSILKAGSYSGKIDMICEGRE